MADRYTYVPLIGVFICVVWAAADIFASARFTKPALATMGVLMIVACATTHTGRVEILAERFPLSLIMRWQSTSDNAVAHYHVGAELEDQGKYELALTHFRRHWRATGLCRRVLQHGIYLSRTRKSE